jgi:hypothetical protein
MNSPGNRQIRKKIHKQKIRKQQKIKHLELINPQENRTSGIGRKAATKKETINKQAKQLFFIENLKS